MPYATHNRTRIFGLGLTMAAARKDALEFQERVGGLDLSGTRVSKISNKLRLSLFDLDGEFIAYGDLNMEIDSDGKLRGAGEVEAIKFVAANAEAETRKREGYPEGFANLWRDCHGSLSFAQLHQDYQSQGATLVATVDLNCCEIFWRETSDDSLNLVGTEENYAVLDPRNGSTWV